MIIAALEGASERELEEFKAGGFNESFDVIGGKDSYWGYGWQGALIKHPIFWS